jgi:4-oxalocrotonate tautomerase
MRTHNAWHLAMFDADSGNVASALGILDTWLLPASMTSPLDACDAAALLWRLAADGVEDDGRWRRISDAFERAWTPGFWPYVDLHAGLAHFSAGQAARAKRLMQEVDALALGTDYAAWRARLITQPGLQALAAWAENGYDRAARLFAQLGPFISNAGGSRVQLDIFKSLEREAARRQRAEQQVLLQSPPKEQEMPLINVKLIEGVFSEPQKKEIAKSLTDAMVRIEGEAMRSVTWCVVEEVKSGDWAIGGQPLTTADVKAIAARKAA